MSSSSRFSPSSIRRAVLDPESRGAGDRGHRGGGRRPGSRRSRASSRPPGAFEEALKEQGLTEAQLRDLVFDTLLEEELRVEVTADAVPTEEELQDYYEQNQASYRQTGAQHILVDENAQAQDIARQLQAAPEGQVDALFKKLAREFSTDTTNAKNAGDLGYFASGDFVPAFEAAAERSTSARYRIRFRRNSDCTSSASPTDASEPFEEVREEIEAELAAGAADKAWSDFVHLAFEDADVKVNPRYGEFDADELTVVDATSEQLPGAAEPTATPATPAPTPGV